MNDVAVVWFKRDLRLRDHAPLVAAASTGFPALLIYCCENEVLTHPDTAPRHLRFVAQSLTAMREELAPFGLTVYEFPGSLEEVLSHIMTQGARPHVFSHQEIGVWSTFERDKRVSAWCRDRGVPWTEYPTNGIVRGLKNREGWNSIWNARMETEPLPAVHDRLKPWNPFEGTSGAEWRGREGILEYEWRDCGATEDPSVFQPGGEAPGWAYLNSFVQKRIERYRRSISKPEEARRGCSRLSPYLAWGNLTIRQIIHALAEADPPWRKDVQFFVARLHWHCHFIQKFESECRMEWENINRGFNSIRTEVRQEWVDAWCAGKTGFPLVDACMRSVVQTGYLNFRMRSMLVSFLTHHLWQPWQSGVHHLARQFLDYEPGIHYAQFQMQAGTQGINTLRIYNPVKQAEENDPNGDFLRKWLPELAHLPLPFLREPWKMTEWECVFYGVRLGEDYPNRLVDHEASARHAREVLWGTKRSPSARQEAAQILERHVSARKNAKRRRR